MLCSLCSLRRLLLLSLLWFGVPARRAEAEIEYVIAISVDGLRGDFLRTFVETAPEEFPNFARLRNLAACTFNARTDYGITLTIPDHLCMLTGRPATPLGGLDVSKTHGYFGNAPAVPETVHIYDSNFGYNSGPYKFSIFDTVHDRGLSTALFLGKNRLLILWQSWNEPHGAPDLIGVNNGTSKIDFVRLIEAQGSDGAVTSAFADELAEKITTGTLKNFTFFHMVDTDYAGHDHGWSAEAGSPYRLATGKVDHWIGQLLDALEDNAQLAGKVALILTADHGGGSPLTGHELPPNWDYPDNYTIPFFLMAPGIEGGTDLNQWFENRADPGPRQPNDLAAEQPVRNGDVANLVATLIGVPLVEGSWHKPELKKPMKVSRLGDGRIAVSWPVYLTKWTLESCTDLGAAPQVWTRVTENIREEGGVRVHTAEGVGTKFFRLRRP